MPVEIMSPLDPLVFMNLQLFKGETILKKAALNMLVKISDTSHLDRQFKKVDLSGTGLICLNDLQKIFAAEKIVDIDLSKLIQEVDLEGNDMINYAEFLAATVDVATFFDE